MKRRIADFKKVVLFTVLALALVAVMAPLALGNGDSAQGEQIFNSKNCLGCHVVGNDPDSPSRPNLTVSVGKNSEDQLEEILRTRPPMSSLVNADEVDPLVAYMLTDKFRSGQVSCEEPIGGNAERGRQLFAGGIAQQSGGTACIACHNAGDMSSSGLGLLGGGSLAKDLTDLYDQRKECAGKDISSLERPGVMSTLFAGKNLTPEETADLYEYFKSISNQTPPSNTVSMVTLALIGLAFSIILLIISQLIWGKRIQGVRKRLVGGSK